MASTEKGEALSRAAEAIAKRYLGLETLETRNSDDLDFHDISVWRLREALEAAIAVGRKERLG